MNHIATKTEEHTRFPDFILRLKDAFDNSGFELYAVGGCVRDRLLGQPVHEFDLTTNARPEEIKRLVRETSPDGMFSVGEKFGTVGAIYDRTRVEITTYRGEWYEPESRKPRVEFSDSLEDDLSRRDFTINAIAEDIRSDSLVDPFGGSADLVRKTVRAIGNPDDRFRDDPLRLLRAVRFASTLSFQIDTDTASAARRSAPQLAKISRERVRDEMSRMLTGPHPEMALSQLTELGLMEYIALDLLELQAVATGGGRHKDLFAHTLKVVSDSPPELVTRWAALLHDVAKPRTTQITDGKVSFNSHETVGADMARRILGGLRYDQSTIRSVANVVRMHTHANSYSDEWTDGAVRRLVRDAGDDLEALLALSEADVTSRHKQKRDEVRERVRRLRERIARLGEEEAIRALRPPIDGTDLLRMFDRPPGPWIKPIKDHLLEMVIDGRLAPDDRETAELIARQKYEELTNQGSI